jgi:uncharacterized protein (TIGR02444 family)
MNNSPLPTHEFWRFSLKFYGKQTVKDICLELQNSYEINVNILLFCCWLASSGRDRLTNNELIILFNTIDYWHRSITEPLRSLRKTLSLENKVEWMKQLRAEVLQQEIIAEQVEQLLLAHILPRAVLKNKRIKQKIDDCIHNFHGYFNYLNIKLDTKICGALNALLADLFPNIIMPKNTIQLVLPI